MGRVPLQPRTGRHLLFELVSLTVVVGFVTFSSPTEYKLILDFFVIAIVNLVLATLRTSTQISTHIRYCISQVAQMLHDLEKLDGP